MPYVKYANYTLCQVLGGREGGRAGQTGEVVTTCNEAGVSLGETGARDGDRGRWQGAAGGRDGRQGALRGQQPATTAPLEKRRGGGGRLPGFLVCTVVGFGRAPVALLPPFPSLIPSPSWGLLHSSFAASLLHR